jgi:hypothetical protein
LHVDHHGVVTPAGSIDHLGQAVRPADVIGTGQHGAQAVALDRRQHLRMVGGHQHFIGTRQDGTLGDAHDHRLAGQVEQRLARQAGSTQNAPE